MPSVKDLVFDYLKQHPMKKFTCDSFPMINSWNASTALSQLYRMDHVIKRGMHFGPDPKLKYEYWYDPTELTKEHEKEINAERDKNLRRAITLQHEIDVRIKELERVLKLL